MYCINCNIDDSKETIDWLSNSEENVIVIHCNKCGRLLGVKY